MWTTKERMPLINSRVEGKIYNYMRNQFIELGCPIGIINGMPDHIHCLFLLNPQRSVADVIKQVKGSSSHYINFENLVQQKFAW